MKAFTPVKDPVDKLRELLPDASDDNQEGQNLTSEELEEIIKEARNTFSNDDIAQFLTQ